MDIAIISEHASPVGAIGGTDAGGQNVYVAQLARHLARLGHKVDVFTRKDSRYIPIVQDIPEGYRLISVPAGPQDILPKEKLLPHMKDFTDFMISFIKKRNRKYDVIHSNFWMSGLVAADIKKALGIPFAVTFHALGRVRRLHQGKDDGFPDQRFVIEDRVVAEADDIIAECPQDYDDLVNLYNAPEESISIVPCGFDKEEMYPLNKNEARKFIGVDPGSEIILHLGRMVPRKGAENVIRGFARYYKEQKKNSKLIIVGGESDKPDPVKTPEIGRLMSFAEEEGISKQVIFTGRKSRGVLRYYYSAADVFVTTPWYEPFGITPVEAMACGTPVIGSEVGGIKYTVEHNATGLLVPPENPFALKDALIKVLGNKQLREKFSKSSRERANIHFRWEVMAEKIEEVLLNRVHQLKAEKIIFHEENNLFIPMNIEGVQNAITKSVIG
ncbi:MAG: glycosyltransferase family 4 protein [Bacteriovoracia bacterium]